MTRALAVVVTGACLAGCGARLIRSEAGWTLGERRYTVAATPDGRIMGDGWLLQNYKRVDKTTLEQFEPSDVDMSYTRSDDDGYLELHAVDEGSGKTLVAICDRYLTAFRHQEQRMRFGNFDATYTLDFPITELARGPVEGEGVEGYEVVIEQRRIGENAPFRMVYLALARPKGTRALVAIIYANTPASFLGGFADARGLARRVKFGGAQLPAELKTLNLGAPKPFEPGTGGTTNL